MIYLMMPNETIGIVGWNMHQRETDYLYEIWVTRIDGRTLKIAYDLELTDAQDYIGALNYAVEKGDTYFSLI